MLTFRFWCRALSWLLVHGGSNTGVHFGSLKKSTVTQSSMIIYQRQRLSLTVNFEIQDLKECLPVIAFNEAITWELSSAVGKQPRYIIWRNTFGLTHLSFVPHVHTQTAPHHWHKNITEACHPSKPTILLFRLVTHTHSTVWACGSNYNTTGSKGLRSTSLTECVRSLDGNMQIRTHAPDKCVLPVINTLSFTKERLFTAKLWINWTLKEEEFKGEEIELNVDSACVIQNDLPLHAHSRQNITLYILSIVHTQWT